METWQKKWIGKSTLTLARISNMKSVVISGANGFIGSHLVNSFVEKGVSVVAIDLPGCNNHLTNHPLVQFFPCKMEDLDQFPQISPAPDVFYHLAWKGVSPQYRDDCATQNENISYCLNAVRLAARLGARKFILPGSTMEYMYTAGPINGNASPTPQNAYGASKIACRFLSRALCEQLGVPFIYTVLTSLYGVGREDNNVLFYVIRSLLEGKRPSLTRLEQKWDFINVDDAIRALTLIGESGRNDAFYAIGNGENRPLSEYVMTVRNLIDPQAPLGIGEIPYKTAQLPHSTIDLTALRRDTGFAPSISFEEGIAQVISYYRNQQKGVPTHA